MTNPTPDPEGKALDVLLSRLCSRKDDEAT